MERVTGIGGVFFKARDPAALTKWYERHLGVPLEPSRTVIFRWREPGMTVWAPFPLDTTYFEPSEAPFMINFRVDDLDRMLAQLREAGVEVDERIEDSEYGRFGWIIDPEGNRVELWQPPEGA